jgi:ribosome-associated protein
LAAAVADDAEPKLAAEDLSAIVLASLTDDKAEDLVVIDLKDKSSVTDAMIIASGRSQRHVGALADHAIRALKDAGVGRARVEGLASADWVLIDAGDLIVHIFRPEVRSYYNLERLWGDDAVGARAPATPD